MPEVTDPVVIRHRDPICASGWSDEDYRLMDSGDGHKLESFGGVVIGRPDAQAVWSPCDPRDNWCADAFYSGEDLDDASGAWRFVPSERPEPWWIGWGGLRFELRFSSFRHLGLFPEHSSQWMWVQRRMSGCHGGKRLLNLFGYTGAMSLAAALSGAEVTHVDASGAAIRHGRRNQAASGLAEAPIRWLRDDVGSFIRREERRGSRYDVIVADPPRYGRGPGRQVWRLERDLSELLSISSRLIGLGGCLILTVYATRLSGLSVAQAVREAFSGRGGVVEYGDLSISEWHRDRVLPAAIWVRWLGGASGGC